MRPTLAPRRAGRSPGRECLRGRPAGTTVGPHRAPVRTRWSTPEPEDDPMAGIDDILSTVPLDQLAGRLGVDEATAQRAVGAALPALLGGLRANAQDPAG
ncbi:MAG: DUF937 domain-containing protein, partial [Cellulosimicrobium funkei]